MGTVSIPSTEDIISAAEEATLWETPEWEPAL